VRGVAVNPNIIKTLLERQWIRVVGPRDLPGRPELLGTTRDFLEYFSLRSLDDLPPLAQLRSLGEIDPQFELPVGGAPAYTEPLQSEPEEDFVDADGSEADASDADEDVAAQRATGLVASPPNGAD
jgi:segregation and condensation protein B